MQEMSAQSPVKKRYFRAGLLFCSFLGLSLLLYRNALGFGFNSDAFVLFRHATESLRSALSWDHSYHYMPLTSFWVWFQHLFFGGREQSYQLLNILQHGVMAFLVYRLARSLKMEYFSSVLAGLLYVFAGSAYQVVLWSIVGANYFVSGVLYLSGLMLFILRCRQGRAGAGLPVAILYALALLAHEQSVSLLPVCFAFSLLFLEASGTASLMQLLDFAAWKRSLHRTGMLFVPLLAFGLMKKVMSSHASVTGFGQEPLAFINGLLQAFARCFCLRGNQEALAWIRAPHSLPLFLLGVLAAVCVLITLFYFLSPLERFLLAWCLGHVILMQMAIGVSVRHTYLPSVPGVLLDVLLLRRLGVYLISRTGRVKNPVPTVRIHLLQAGCAMVLLLLPGFLDISAVSDLWAIADRQTGSLRRCLGEVFLSIPDTRRLYLLNPRSRIRDERFEVYILQNGAASLVKSTAPFPLRNVTILHTMDDNNVASSRWTSQQVLERILDQKGSALVFFDPGISAFARLNHEILKEKFSEARMIDAPSMLSETTHPVLPWKEGKFPYLEIAPGESLEFDINNPEECGNWFFMHFLADPDRRVALAVDGIDLDSAELGKGVRPQWSQEIFLVPGMSQDSVEVSVRITALGPEAFLLAHAGLLPVRRDFSAQTTPEMPWSVNNVLKLIPGMVFKIPVPDCEMGPCAVSLVHRVEFDGVMRLVNGEGELGVFGEPVEERSPRWISEIYNGSKWQSAWVEITPVPSRGTRILQMHFDFSGESMVVGGGIGDLYWAGPGGAELSRSGRFLNPWILGLAFLCMMIIALGVFLLLLKRVRKTGKE